MSDRPLLIGINNPVSSEPEHVLFPYPPGCTGHRILQMLQSRMPDITRRQYLQRFERRDLVPFKVVDMSVAKASAARIQKELWGTGRTVVLFGEEVRKAFGHPRLLLHPQLIGGATWRQVPHPSGRNQWYNEQANRDLVAMLLEDLYNGEVK